jgi:hypothetical protein
MQTWWVISFDSMISVKTAAAAVVEAVQHGGF